MKKNIAIVIPFYNEEKNIPILIDKILDLKEDMTIIAVNDNSTDNSKRILNKLASNNKELKIINRKKQEGLHAVLIDGLQKAIDLGADGVVTMDGDLSHPPNVIPEMLKYADNYDLIIGSRFIAEGETTNWNMKKKILSAITRHSSQLLLGIRTKDCSSGFRYYDSSVLNYLDFNNFITAGYAFQIETILRAEKNNFKVKEIPITFKGRMYGESKVDFKELKRYFKSFFKLFRI